MLVEQLPPKPPQDKRTVGPVRAITAHAFPISAHGHADWDSLSLDVFGWDGSGRPVKLRGTLRATLWGQRQQLVRSHGEQFFPVPGAVRKIACWTRSLHSSSADAAIPVRHANRRLDEIRALTYDRAGTRRLVLPLPRPLPDHDLSWAGYGELHVQLLVPGEGVFETTQRDVVLRHVSIVRNRNLVETGSRFFPQETTHDSRRRSRLRFRDFSGLRPNGRVLSVQP